MRKKSWRKQLTLGAPRQGAIGSMQASILSAIFTEHVPMLDFLGRFMGYFRIDIRQSWWLRDYRKCWRATTGLGDVHICGQCA